MSSKSAAKLFVWRWKPKARGGWSHFFKLRLGSCSKSFESRTGSGVKRNLWPHVM